MTLVIITQGPFAGQAMNVASAHAGAGIADGWAAPTSNGYPYPASIYRKMKPPASYDTWIGAGMPPGTPNAPAVSGAVVTITKTNPAVLTLSTTDFAKFAANDYVNITGTGAASVDGKQFRLINPNGTNKTFELSGTNLIALPANLTTGTVTKV